MWQHRRLVTDPAHARPGRCIFRILDSRIKYEAADGWDRSKLRLLLCHARMPLSCSTTRRRRIYSA